MPIISGNRQATLGNFELTGGIRNSANIVGGGGGGSSDFTVVSSVASLNNLLSFVNSYADGVADAFGLQYNAYPGMEWFYDIGVHGGRWPYVLELTSAPAGMTIGSVMVASEGRYSWTDVYQRITWENPTAGNHTITVRVTDQDGTQVTRTWTLVCGTAGWVFVSPSGSNSNDGSINSPLRTDFGFHGGSAFNTASQNQRIVWRGGNHIIQGHSEANGNYRIGNGASKNFLGFPGEEPILNLQNGWFVINSSNPHFSGLTIAHDDAALAATGKTDHKIFAVLAAVNRMDLTRLKITNYSYGPSTGENPSMFYSDSSVNNNVFMNDWDITGNFGNIVTSYKHTDSLYQRIKVHNATFSESDASNNWGAIYLKDAPNRLTVRGVEMYDNVSWSGGSAGCVAIGSQNGAVDVDICYNKLKFGKTGARQGAFNFYGAAYGDAQVFGVHTFRNTLVAPTAARVYNLEGNGNQTNHIDQANIYQPGVGADNGNTQINNLAGAGFVDDTTLDLTGGNAANRGTHGAEIY